MTRIAIIGAGMSGLVAACRLQQRANVTLFEKSWRAGGRVTTRNKRYAFDHGAQYFVVKTKAFEQFLQPLIKQGLVERWDARFVEIDRNQITSRRKWSDEYPHYVAVPGMTDLAQHLASGLDIHYQTRVTEIIRQNQQWALVCEGKALGQYDWVVLATPAPQAAAVMPNCFCHVEQLKNISMEACCSLMLGFAQPFELEFDAALVKNTDISWISVNSSKPGRARELTLVAHSTNQWADNHLQLSSQSVTEHLVSTLNEILETDVSAADHVELHRWRYANIQRQSGPSSLVDDDNKLAAIGDWCISGRIESAFTSGFELSIS